MPAFTVVLLYPDYLTDDFGADIYVDSAEAEDGHAAARVIQARAQEANKDSVDVDVALDATNF